jgi:hypothetical protein
VFNKIFAVRRSWPRHLVTSNCCIVKAKMATEVVYRWQYIISHNISKSGHRTLTMTVFVSLTISASKVSSTRRSGGMQDRKAQVLKATVQGFVLSSL